MIQQISIIIKESLLSFPPEDDFLRLLKSFNTANIKNWINLLKIDFASPAYLIKIRRFA